jgi:L-Ala-D/L-Glu epimerase
MKMSIETIQRPLASPFVITGYTFTHLNAVWVTLEDDGYRGRGEGVGMYYRGETPETMTRELESIRRNVEGGASRGDLLNLLPPGGARNAVDCALWDFECRSRGTTVWNELGLTPRPLATVATIGLGTPEEMAHKALGFADYPHLKIKLGADAPMEKLRAIREVRPDATLVVDVNQGWSMSELEQYVPTLVDVGVAMVEQPLPRGGDDELVGFSSPVALGADESCIDESDYDEAATKYDVINIKLDKCGGLTAALAIAKRAIEDGKDVMVGNMTGTSLSMAPSHVIGQMCRFVDIDGPLLLASDIVPGLHYGPGGMVSPPGPDVWGS